VALLQPRPSNPFVFLSVFKWEHRKGWDILLKAFTTQFTSADPVELYMLTNPFHSNSDFLLQMRDFLVTSGLDMTQPERLPRIYVIDTHIPTLALPHLYRAADVFVLPSRGEGWGRPHVEAMSMGVPILATNFSGPTAYLDESVGFPISVDSMSTIRTGPFRNHTWAEASVPHLRELMAYAAANRGEVQARGARARVRMVDRYHPTAVARVVLERLAAIEARLRERADAPATALAADDRP
jgi:glycosyltransferase involved in cell wall biosynthesis